MPVLHPLESLGLEKIGRGEIRAERLEDRTKPKVPFPHRHNFVQICWLSQASGWHEIDFNRYRAKANQLFYMKPGQAHAWNFTKSTRGFLVEFTHESLAPNSASRRRLPDLVQIPAGQSKTFARLFEAMHEEFVSHRELRQECLQGYLSVLMTMITRLAPAQTEERLTLLEKFETLLEANYRREHRVEFYAKALGETAKSLNVKLTRALKKSPRALIQDRITLEAKRLLSYSDLNVTEVGAQLGFDDANYFTRFFTLQTKTSPRAFRQRA